MRFLQSLTNKIGPRRGVPRVNSASDLDQRVREFYDHRLGYASNPCGCIRTPITLFRNREWGAGPGINGTSCQTGRKRETPRQKFPGVVR